MRLQMETTEKLAQRFGPHAAFEAKHKEGGDDQADEPSSAYRRFPQRRFRVAISALARLEVTMHAAFGQASVCRKTPDALLPVFTNRVEKEHAFGPQSHGFGLSYD